MAQTFLCLSRDQVAGLILLTAAVLFHYTTNSIPPAHYTSLVLAVTLVLLFGPRLSLWQGYGLAFLAAVLLLGDRLWLGSVRYEIMTEGAAFFSFLLAIRAVNYRAPGQAATEATGWEREYYWDFAANTAMGTYITDMEAGFIAQSLAQYPWRPELVIDAGAGSGRLTSLVSTHSDHVIATEVDRSLVDALASSGANVSPVLVSQAATRLPVGDNSADCIVCVEVPDLTHQEWFYRECSRVLKPGGMLIMTLQNRRSWKGLLAGGQGRRYRTKHGAAYYRYSTREVMKSLRKAGLHVEEAQGFNWLPLNRVSDSPLVPSLARLEGLLQLRRLVAVSPWVILRARRMK